MLFLCQHGYETLLERELMADGLTVVETGPGWAGAEPLPGDAVPRSIDELCFPHLTLLAPREIRGEGVNALAQQLADYFLESLRGEKIDAAWPCVFLETAEVPGLGRRASAVEKAFRELLEKKLRRVARLATPEVFGANVVAPAMRALHDWRPEIQVELIAQSRAVSLTKREADLAITLSRPPRGRLHVQKLTPYRLGLYASRDYLAESGAPTGLDELRSRPLVWFIDEMIDIPELRYLDQIAAGARTAFRSTSIAAQHAAIAAGLGFGVLHCYVADQDPRLERVLADVVTIERTYWLVSHSDERHLPRVRTVIEFLQEQVRGARDRF